MAITDTANTCIMGNPYGGSHCKCCELNDIDHSENCPTHGDGFLVHTACEDGHVHWRACDEWSYYYHLRGDGDFETVMGMAPLGPRPNEIYIKSYLNDNPSNNAKEAQMDNTTCWAAQYLASKLVTVETKISEYADLFVELMLGKSPEDELQEYDDLTTSLKSVARTRAKAEGWRSMPIVNIYKPAKGNTERLKAGYVVSNGPVGLITHYWGKKYDLPVIRFQNNLPLEEDGSQPDIPADFWSPVHKAGYILVKGKWAIKKEVVRVLSDIFPVAVDFRAYVSGLCGPMVHIDDYDCIIKTRENWMGEAAGSDGCGCIHPEHDIWEALGIPRHKRNVVQIRAFNLGREVFVKGILVCDERCVDKSGKPAIWIDPLQIKGTRKADAKKLHANGLTANIKLHLGIMQTWTKPRQQKLNFQALQFAENSPENQAFIKTRVEEAFEKLTMDELMEIVMKRDENLGMVCAICDKLGVDPKTVPQVSEQLMDELGRQLYHIQQGAGIMCEAPVVVMDNSLEPGEVVMAAMKINGKRRYRVGDRLAITRAPGLQPACLMEAEIVEAFSHMLIKGRTDYIVPSNTIFMNPMDMEHLLMGDDDGDGVACSWDPEMIRFYESRIPLLGKPEDVYLIEPKKNTDGHLDKIPTKSWDGVKLIAVDGQGPVGMATNACAMFLALDETMPMMAAMCLNQEFIDQLKRNPLFTNMDKAMIGANWRVVEEYERNGKTCCCWKYDSTAEDGSTKRSMVMGPESWYVDEYGGFIPGKFSWWVKRTAAELGYVVGTDDKGRPVGMSWKHTNTWQERSKRINPNGWVGTEYTGENQNLVHYCSWEAWGMFQDWKKDNMPEQLSVNLEVLLYAGLKEEPRMALPESTYQRGVNGEPGLYEKSGLRTYGENVGRIMRSALEPDQRNGDIEACRVELRNCLKNLTWEELLTIWSTEMSLSREYGSHKELSERHIKRAFRAVAWEGSPVLDKLGIIQVNAGCDYMTPERVKAVESMADMLLKETDEHGKPVFKDIHEVLSSLMYGPYGRIEGTSVSLPEPMKHYEETGVQFLECPDCKSLVSAIAVRRARAKPSKAMMNGAGRLCTAINKHTR